MFRKKTVGLALGAGSTKGFAHIGVLQVLEENRIPVDMVAGCSIGAIVGGVYAAGTDLRLLGKLVSSINVREYFDFSIPTSGGFLKGGKLQELIRVLTHDDTFADTRIPFYCVAVDAQSGELVVLSSGKLHECIRASMSIPGIFQPVHLDGRIYMDGGVIERVPSKMLRDHGADVVIGVDVGFRGGSAQTEDMNAYDALNRALELMQWENARMRQKDADIMVVPNVRFVKGRFQTDKAEDCILEGRRAAIEALPQIMSLLKKKHIPLIG